MAGPTTWYGNLRRLARRGHLSTESWCKADPSRDSTLVRFALLVLFAPLTESEGVVSATLLVRTSWRWPTGCWEPTALGPPPWLPVAAPTWRS